MLARRDALEHLDCDAALEQLGEHDQPFEQVPAQPVDLLHGEHVPVAQVVERGLQAGPVVDREPAADLLLEHLHADRVERVVLTRGVLTLRAHPHESHECHARHLRSENLFSIYSQAYRYLNGFMNTFPVHTADLQPSCSDSTNGHLLNAKELRLSLRCAASAAHAARKVLTYVTHVDLPVDPGRI